MVAVTTARSDADDPPAGLERVFDTQLSVVGSTMGSRAELQRLISFLDVTGARPAVGRVLPLTDAREGFETMAAAAQFGTIVFTVD